MGFSWLAFVGGIIIVFIASTEAYPYALNASNIGAESVVLKWYTTEKNVEEFKVHCSGIRHYVTMHNEPHTEVDVLSHYVPGALNHVLMGNVQANFNYSCMITEQLDGDASVLGSRVSHPFHFATDFLSPEEPKMPEVHQPEGHPLTIVLFPVSSKFGPILGYKVQFHVSNEQTPDGAPIINDDMMVPFGKFSPASQHVAVVSTVPKSFQLTFSNGDLPPSIGIDSGLLMGALKNKAMYSAVTIAYSKNKRQMELNSDEVLFTTSKPSQPFIARGYTQIESVAEKSTYVRPRQLSVAISVGVILPLLVIGYMVSVGVYLLCREQRLRTQQRKALFTREDIVEASQLRKTQRHDDMPWIQPSHGMGDLPWLHPNSNNNDTSSLITEQGQSTSISRPRSTPQVHSHSTNSNSNDTHSLVSMTKQGQSTSISRPRSTPQVHSHSTNSNSSDTHSLMSMTKQGQSTPISRPSSTPQVHSYKERSVPVNNTGNASGQVDEQMGYTISEPTKYDISNFHSPGHTNDILSFDPYPRIAPHSFKKNSSDLHTYRTHSLPYVTIASTEEREDTLDDVSVEANSSPPQHTIQSPTKFFSAPDFSSEVSPSDANQQFDDGAQLSQGILLHTSSSMFIPRGLSSGPHLVTRPGAQPSPIQTLFSQLSQASLSQQEDQAPDLDMDLYDITIA